MITFKVYVICNVCKKDILIDKQPYVTTSILYIGNYVGRDMHTPAK